VSKTFEPPVDVTCVTCPACEAPKGKPCWLRPVPGVEFSDAGSVTEPHVTRIERARVVSWLRACAGDVNKLHYTLEARATLRQAADDLADGRHCGPPRSRTCDLCQESRDCVKIQPANLIRYVCEECAKLVSLRWQAIS